MMGECGDGCLVVDGYIYCVYGCGYWGDVVYGIWCVSERLCDGVCFEVDGDCYFVFGWKFCGFDVECCLFVFGIGFSEFVFFC